jgi:hypothetical protein
MSHLEVSCVKVYTIDCYISIYTLRCLGWDPSLVGKHLGLGVLRRNLINGRARAGKLSSSVAHLLAQSGTTRKLIEFRHTLGDLEIVALRR